MKVTYRDVLIAVLKMQNALDRKSEAFFYPYGITSAQFNVLNLLSTDGEMGQADLTAQLLVGKASVSIVLNRMVKSGLVTRRQHDKDRRHVILTLTAKGRQLWKKVFPEYEEAIRTVFGALPESQRPAFLRSLNLIYATLQSEGSPKSRISHK